MDKPRHIDLHNTEFRGPGAALRVGLPSPRIQHYDGDVPPSLSPLDAFAAHSRRLAKELEETRIAGQRRMSRLPPQVVTQSLTQHQASRPAIFRSLSSNSQDEIPPVPPLDRDLARGNLEITQPAIRPRSAYPRISAIMRSTEDEGSDAESERSLGRESTVDAYSVSAGLHQTSHPHDYFGMPQSASPIQDDASEENKKCFADVPGSSSQSDLLHSLAPPNAAFARSKLYSESSEDDYASSNAGSFFSQPRKMSSSSGVSVPPSPAVVHQRTSSNNSTVSLTGAVKLPPHLNFSRPRSSASFHGKLDSPTVVPRRVLQRKASQTSEYDVRGKSSFDDTRSVMSDGYLANEASSYTHSKFVLPRGRVAADRTSALFSALSTPHFEWKEPMFPGTPPLSARTEGFRDASPHVLDRVNSDQPHPPERGVFSFEFERARYGSLDEARRPSSSGPGASVRLVGVESTRPATSHGTATGEPHRTPSLPDAPGSTGGVAWDARSRSTATNSTIRPTTARSAPNHDVSAAEDHVTRAIELHEHGDLKESTYHLRVAAKQNHPTGMLLYALACRHGWGMRPNPREGVAWLKKAVDTAMVEVADDEDSANTATATATSAATTSTPAKSRSDFHEKKAHRAQFALSIYELGVSHLNGWGVEQDKALALRCFEIAGNWGDPDALTEAGFCYAEGIGCKKDLRKAASFYRRAADKGVSMVGNSWIYKDKYNNRTEVKKGDHGREARPTRKDSNHDKEKVPRSKSKSRSIFGRKRSTAVPA